MSPAVGRTALPVAGRPEPRYCVEAFHFKSYGSLPFYLFPPSFPFSLCLSSPLPSTSHPSPPFVIVISLAVITLFGVCVYTYDKMGLPESKL